MAIRSRKGRYRLPIGRHRAQKSERSRCYGFGEMKRTGTESPIPARELADLADLFELVASSRRPNLVVPLFAALAGSPASPALVELCASWGVQLKTFIPSLRLAIATLERLLRRRGRRIAETDITDVRAVCSLAMSRAGRSTVARERARLRRIASEFAEACDLEQTRQEINEFLTEPPPAGARDLVDRYFGKHGDP